MFASGTFCTRVPLGALASSHSCTLRSDRAAARDRRQQLLPTTRGASCGGCMIAGWNQRLVEIETLIFAAHARGARRGGGAAMSSTASSQKSHEITNLHHAKRSRAPVDSWTPSMAASGTEGESILPYSYSVEARKAAIVTPRHRRCQTASGRLGKVLARLWPSAPNITALLV
ncbi:hypothetical protein B0H14DRAFT_3159847 [Mycena olivaceomarginata]|nr:hypothetical protein B0H14DRAFT_3159847 [Mycena olivaceomarginata]